MPIIVFHWQRRYIQAAQTQAFLECREATIDDIIADFGGEPRYSCSAFAVPPGTKTERKQLRRLIETSGFWKDAATATWVAPDDGETPLTGLKTALDHAAISAVHYHDVPSTFIVSVTVDGQL